MDSLQDLTCMADMLLVEMKQVPGCYSNANRSLIEALALGVKGLAESLKTLSPDGPSMLQCKECRVQETLARVISMAPLTDLADCGHSWQLYDRPPVLQLEPPVDWAERSEYALKHLARRWRRNSIIACATGMVVWGRCRAPGTGITAISSIWMPRRSAVAAGP